MKREDRTRSSRLPESNIINRTGTTHNTNPTLPFSSIISNGFKHITPVAYFKNMSSKSVSTFTGDNNRWFWFVFGTRRTAAGAATGAVAGTGGGLVGVIFGVLRDLEVEIRVMERRRSRVVGSHIVEK
ncbi:hypothetical protein Hanom_Chr04g00373621 [Helianthus anomalus]